MEAVMEPVIEQADAATLAKKSVCLSVTMGLFGNRKQASLADVTFGDASDKEQQPDKSLLTLTKKLIDSEELQAIMQHDSRTSRMVGKYAFPSMFRSGIYLVSNLQVKEVDTLLAQRATERQALVNIAVVAYPQRVEETSKRLGVVHDPLDYPTAAAFASTFRFAWRWMAWETPKTLKMISAEIFEREREKAQQDLASVADECRQAMRAGMFKLVDHLRDRLAIDPATGKQKRLNASTVTNLQEFLQTFELRDITSDSDLSKIVKQARAVMDGVDVATLKGDDAMRAKIEKELGDLCTALDPLVVSDGARTIILED